MKLKILSGIREEYEKGYPFLTVCIEDENGIKYCGEIAYCEEHNEEVK